MEGCRIMCLENKKAHGQRFHQHELEKLCPEENMRSSANESRLNISLLCFTLYEIYSHL